MRRACPEGGSTTVDPAPAHRAPVLDVATKRYIVKTAVRWAPLLVAALTLALVVALAAPIPTTRAPRLGAAHRALGAASGAGAATAGTAGAAPAAPGAAAGPVGAASSVAPGSPGTS